MADSPGIIVLNCYVVGDPPSFYIALSVALNSSIWSLKDAFIKSYEGAHYGELNRPIFYKVDRAPEDLAPRVEDQQLGLGAGWLVRDCWPEPDKIDRERVHVLVHCNAPSKSSKEINSETRKESEDASELSINAANLRLKFLEELGDSSSSKASRPKGFREQQATERHILIGRPAGRTGPPIVLYHPVFGRFLRNLQSLQPLSAEIYARTAHYFQTSQELYADESARLDGRDESSQHLLGIMLGDLLLRLGDDETQPDGVVVTRDGAWCIIMEMINEIGLDGCDPSIQVAQSYSRCWKRSPRFLDRCCCPSILIAVAGPWMCILGAIFLDRPVIQPLTDYLWIGDNPNKPSNVDRIARVFHAITEARCELEDYYSNISSSDQGYASFFPYLTHYVDLTGKRVAFKYEKHVNRSGRSSGKKELVFLARTLEGPPTRIVVKFVTRYHSAAHRLLAKEKLAPELLYDGTVYLEDQPGPEHSMIVMEYVNGVDLGKSTDCPLPECVSVDVKRALRLLHGQNLVFGDLRPPNVILVKDAIGKVTGARLIDFDWCGKHLEGRYPWAINKTTITWADGVDPGALLDKAHDNEMWKQLGLS